jgi:serine/threonine-protein kinase RsbW
MVTSVSFSNERTAHRYNTKRSAWSGKGVGRISLGSRSGTVRSTDSVDLRVPADPAYLAMIRTATAGLATRLDLTLDEIEDLRIAVDEACSLLLEGRAHPGRALDAGFEVGPPGSGALSILITGPLDRLPEGRGYAWSVLKALAGAVVTGVGENGAWIKLTYVGRGDQ